jgi:hypothetical protein
MKEKILAQLVVGHPGVTKKYLGLIADKLAGKVTEESGIEDAIKSFDEVIGVKDFCDTLQREGDSRVTEAKKNNQPTPKPEPSPAPAPQPQPGEPLDQMAQLVQAITSLTGEVKQLKTEKTVQTKRELLSQKLKDVPESFWGKRAIDVDLDVDAFEAEVIADWAVVKQTIVNTSGAVVPPVGTAADKKKTEEIASDVKNYVESVKQFQSPN